MTLQHYLSKRGGHVCSSRFLKRFVAKLHDFSYRQIETLVNSAYQHHLLQDDYDGITSNYLEYAYNKFVVSAKVLKSKIKFDWKNWFKENSVVIQTISSSLHIATICVGIGAASIFGINAFIKNTYDLYI